MYRVKQVPEDFFVREVIDLKINKEGRYFYYLLKKRNYNTLDAIKHIRAGVKYAGNKDKNAVTEQFISVDKKIPELKMRDLEIKYAGRGDSPISLGSHKGNYFEIIVRNLDENAKDAKIAKRRARRRLKNYFGEQRFSRNNIQIGRNILKRNFREAVRLIGLSEVKDNDYIGALRKLPLNLLRLYIHAYQAFLFNRAIKNFESGRNMKIPVIGFESEIDNIKNGKLKAIVNRIMREEKINPRDFIIKEIPELSSEGAYRDLFMEIKDLKTGKLEEDDLNKDKYKIKLSFILNKGCYATVAIKDLFE